MTSNIQASASIDAQPGKSIYDDRYFEYQSGVGQFGGWAHLPKFSPHISPKDTVLDFGCGGGYLLKNLQCQQKFGVEINPAARAIALENGVNVAAYTSEIPDASIDVVISNHALEHTRAPFEELRQLYRVLKPGGRLVIYVPCESVFRRFKRDDDNHHLYSWSPMCLGNLVSEAGFRSVDAKPCIQRYPPKAYRLIAHYGGMRALNLASTAYGWLNPTLSQSMATAIKPAEAAPSTDA